MEKRHLEQAILWMRASDFISEESQSESNERFAVATAMAMVAMTMMADVIQTPAVVRIASN